ncbi:lamin tail domain-containing protein [Nocardioides hwasunensis]|uniref:Lamin tail domain-containing protein n=1 Tax=Nocardioides hwasunensis TaxID=397258 RepID=A0ABR8ML00_9ACTN|nr:lamin tail domain-containing protein [Nocardioides hwasunensis]MBD3915194.1 lamin tail domain-containing protein [Nocardioides hwasunensis]
MSLTLTGVLAAGVLATTAATSPAAAAPSSYAGTVVLNEVRSNPNPDVVELFNAGTLPVDIQGWTVLDDDPLHTPAAITTTSTVIQPGGYHVFDPATLTGGFGLGANDEVTIADATGKRVGNFSWEGIGAPGNHANPSYGRCPHGTGEMVLQAAATPGATNSCPPAFDPLDVRLNEVESNGDTVADWVELTNIGAAPADVSGWKLKDAGANNPFVTIPSGTVIQPGGFFAIYTETPPPGFGLGVDDTVTLYQADGTSKVDEHSWSGGHAATTYGRCPDGTGTWQVTTVPTRGAANACSSIRLNEISSSPTDWVELVNLSDAPVDVTGWVVKDSTDVAPATLSGMVPARGHLVVEGNLPGLGGADSARLYDPAAKLIDSFSWTTHGVPTYARCADGVGSFVASAAATKGTTNDCPGLETKPWFGSQDVVVSDLAETFNQDASGVVFDPADPSGKTLWVAQNKAGTLFKMTKDGATWVPAAGWAGGKNPRYDDGTGAPDTEGITIGPDGAVYLAAERDNSVSGVSRNTVLRYVPGTSASSMHATDEWNLNDLLPTLGANLGLEGITWIPDSALTAGGFLDQAKGKAYAPADYPHHGTGLYAVAVEGTGLVYVVALEQTVAVQEKAHLVATIDPQLVTNAGPAAAMDVAWDPETAQLRVLCDDSCDGTSVAMELAAGAFAVAHAYDRPLGMPNLNNEGIAFAPQSACVGGRKEVVWSDDGDTDGHSLRSGTVPCQPPATTPTDPTTPAPTTPAPTTPAPTVTPAPTPVPVPTPAPVVKQPAEIRVATTRVRGTVGERIRVRVRIASEAGPGTGQVKVRVRGTRFVFKVPVKNGTAVIRLPRFQRAGAKKIVLKYLGDDSTKRSTTTIRAIITG